MKNYIALLIICLFAFTASAQTNIQWQRTLGGTDNETAHTLQQTMDGGYLMVGDANSMNGDVTDGKGGGDIWLVKLDAHGATQWSKSLGGSQFEYPAYQNILLTSDGGFVLGGETSSEDGDVSFNHGESDFWLIKLDSTGTIIWEKTYGGSDREMFSEFKQTSDGGFVMIGFTWSSEGDFSSNQGESDAYVVKTDAQGNVEWQKTYGGSMAEFGGLGHILQTSDGGYFFTVTTYSFDGDVSAGYHGAVDFWSVRLDATGNILWERALGGSDDEFLSDVFSTPDGGFIVAGSSGSDDGDISEPKGSSANAWVIKLDADGFTEWDHNYGGTTVELMDRIYATPDGGYIMTCQSFSVDGDVTDSHSNGLYVEVWVAKIDANGSLQWQRALGGSDDERFGHIALTSDGGYLMTSYTYSNDGDVSGYKAEADVWLAKLNSTGVLQWQKTYGGNRTEYPLLDPIIAIDNGIIMSNITYSNDGDVTGFHGPENKQDIWLVKLAPETVAVADINNPSEGLQLSPNPATQFVRVSVDTPETTLTVTIRDVFGLELSRQTILNGGKLDVSGLPVGCYFVSIAAQAGKILTQKFIKEL